MRIDQLSVWLSVGALIGAFLSVTASWGEPAETGGLEDDGERRSVWIGVGQALRSIWVVCPRTQAVHELRHDESAFIYSVAPAEHGVAFAFIVDEPGREASIVREFNAATGAWTDLVSGPRSVARRARATKARSGSGRR